jgi:hypothetical protein
VDKQVINNNEFPGWGGNEYDEEGNLYVMGATNTTAMNWVNINCPGGVCSTSFLTEADSAVVKFDSAGKKILKYVDENPYEKDGPWSFVRDRSGNIYLASTSTTRWSETKWATGWQYNYSPGGAQTLRLVKFNAAGTRQWVYSSTWFMDSNSKRLQVDGAGVVYMSGVYNPTGDLTVMRFSGASNIPDSTLVVTANDPQYCGGGWGQLSVNEDGTVGGSVFDMWTLTCGGSAVPQNKLVKLNAAGTGTEWVRSSGTVMIDGTGIAPDGSVLALYHITLQPDCSTVTVQSFERMTATGASVFTKAFPVTANATESFSDLEMDSASNMYCLMLSATGTGVCGGGPNSIKNYRIAKWDTAGNEVWSLPYVNGLENDPMDLELDRAGNIYVSSTAASCTTYNSGGICQDIRLVKYTVTPGRTTPQLMPAGKKIQLTLPDNGAVTPSKGQDAVISVRATGTVEGKVYAANGKIIRDSLPQDIYGDSVILRWDAKDKDGKEVGSGVYMIRVAATGIEKIFKVVIVR